jgi:hypothetical protein
VAALADGRHERLASGVAAAPALAGAGWALARTAAEEPVAWRTLGVDPWRALLLAGALLVVAVEAERSRSAWESAALLAGAAAGALPLTVGTAHELAIALPVATAGVACAGLAARPTRRSAGGARRSLALLLGSDVLALAGLASALDGGTGLPPRPGAVGGAVLLAAALVRLGAVPVPWAPRWALEAGGAVRALWLGPARAQGLLLASFALGAGRHVAHAAAAAGVATVALEAAGGSIPGRRNRAAGGLRATTGLAGLGLAGLALGGTVAVGGGLLAVAASFCACAAWAAGGAWREAARPTLAALPVGGAAAGAAAVTAAALAGSPERPWLLALAIPGLVGALALTATAASEGDRRPGARSTSGLAAAAAVAALVALAAVPGRALGALGEPVAASLDVGRPLAEGPPGGGAGVAEPVAVLAAVAGAVALAIGPGRTGAGGAPERGRPTRRPRTVSERARRGWGVAAALLGAAAVALAALVFVAAAGRGFL